ncbi:MAG: EAL domain-containing protein [Desulfobulbales bacterium]
MYEIKKSGRSGFLFFSAEMNTFIQHRLELEAGLRKAIRNNELSMFYQPQVRLQDSRIVGVEALIRWNTKGPQSIPPSRFIPVAEESGLILLLSQWAFQKVCRQTRICRNEIRHPITIGVNISPRYFQEDNLTDQLGSIIRETGIKHCDLDLEITEGLIMQDIERSIDLLRCFRKLGGTVLIDDFGTGDQLSILQSLGCDIIQGNYFSTPLPKKQATALLKKSPYLKRPAGA